MRRSTDPPKMAEWIVYLLARSGNRQSLMGDLEEEFHYICAKDGKFRANLWYIGQIFNPFIHFILSQILWSIVMFKNYFKIAIRTWKKHTGYSLINLVGLALGMTCVIFITLFITDELSYDRYHEKADRVFRLASESRFSGPIRQAPLAPLLQREIPEIENFARFYPVNAFGRRVIMSHGENNIFFKDFYFADPSLFRIFSFEITAGDRSNPLRDLNSLILTQNAAARLFGRENPIGRTVSVDHEFEFVVTAILKNIPRNSHFDIDGIVPLEFYGRFHNEPKWKESWGNSAFMSYLLFTPGTKVSDVQAKIDAAVAMHVPPNRVSNLFLQPLTDIHLRSHFFYELAANSDIRYIYVFGTIALLVLLMAGINYVNLSTARALSRAREVGLRKVVGARRGQLIRQFLGESVFLSFLALISALGLVIILMPVFSLLTGKNISVSTLFHWKTILILPTAAFLLGMAAGGGPALFLSAFQPHRVLSGRINLGRGGAEALRKTLVTAQFVISIVLIACSGILFKQMNFIRTTNLGFNKDQTVVVNSQRNKDAIAKIPLITEQYRSMTGVINSSASSHTPGIPGNYRMMKAFGNNIGEEDISVLSLWTDSDFAETYQLEFAAGRDFSRDIATDKTSACILNETAVKALGWVSPEEAVGLKVDCNNKIGTVIGVVKDFHFHSLHSLIEPMILRYEKKRFYALSVRISAGNIRSTLKALKSGWEKILPHVPFHYNFIEEQFAVQYQADQKVGRIMGIFTILAVIISCLGLFGLAVFSTERRIKEIGVRKVLGASTGGIMLMLSREFTRWVVLANLLAWPAAHFIMLKWLEGFAYRIEIGLGSFLLAGILALGIALVTVSYQSVKVATTDPVKALRYE